DQHRELHSCPTRRSSDLRGTNAWVDIHPTVVGPIPRWSGDPNGQHDDVAFSWVVGHGISPEEWLVIFHDQVPHTEFVPIAFINIRWVSQFGLRRDVHVFEIDRDFGDVYLDIAARLEV